MLMSDGVMLMFVFVLCIIQKIYIIHICVSVCVMCHSKDLYHSYVYCVCHVLGIMCVYYMLCVIHISYVICMCHSKESVHLSCG